MYSFITLCIVLYLFIAVVVVVTSFHVFICLFYELIGFILFLLSADSLSGHKIRGVGFAERWGGEWISLLCCPTDGLEIVVLLNVPRMELKSNTIFPRRAGLTPPPPEPPRIKFTEST